jgi:hypothetical protein
LALASESGSEYLAAFQDLDSATFSGEWPYSVPPSPSSRTRRTTRPSPLKQEEIERGTFTLKPYTLFALGRVTQGRLEPFMKVKPWTSSNRVPRATSAWLDRLGDIRRSRLAAGGNQRVGKNRGDRMVVHLSFET